MVLTKIEIISINKVYIENNYFCFFVCAAIEEKLIRKNLFFLLTLPSEFYTCLTGTCNLLTCL